MSESDSVPECVGGEGGNGMILQEEENSSHRGWLHLLAQAELHPDAEKIFQLGRNFDPQQLVEESTIEFLHELREQFQGYAKAFNAYSDGGSRFQEMKVYAVAQTAADFMLFRNQMKLIFSHAAHGVIQISFAQHIRGILAVNGQEQISASTQQNTFDGKSQELLAQIGAFRDIFWTYQGEKITAHQVARFYFAEFARMTRHLKRSKMGDQLLLDQIKALLQEKGLDLE